MWKNDTANGPRFNVTFSRIYKSDKGWESSSSFGRDELPMVTMYRVKQVLTGCEFKTVGDIQPGPIQDYLAGQREGKRFGHRTYNHYLQAIGTFLNWCVSTRLLLSNPLTDIEKLNTELTFGTNGERSRLMKCERSLKQRQNPSGHSNGSLRRPEFAFTPLPT